MISVIREVEIDDKVIEIEFICSDPIKNDASYDDEFGTVKCEPHWMVEQISWATELFMCEHNFQIDSYLNKNYNSIQNEVIDKYLDGFNE